MNMRSAYRVLVVAGAIAACAGAGPKPAGTNKERVTEYRDGRWYDGSGFVAGSRWVAGERFVERPEHVDTVVELGNAFVVPPFGEGHNHWLEPALVDTYVGVHLRQGIFYVRDMSTPPAFHDAIRAKLNRSDAVDYIAAHQGFTGPGGHPIELVVMLAGVGVVPKEWAATSGEGDAVFVVESAAQVAAAWPRLLAGRPDFVKLFLARSEDYAATRANAKVPAKERGMDPALVGDLVVRAHAAKLRVAAHIVTANDFHVAIAAGVDDIAHLPFVQAGDVERYRLAEADVRAAGARHATVATTLDWLGGAPASDARLAVTRDNIARLRAAGAILTVGTDLFRTTARAEAERILALGVMTPAELLHAWCIDTPRSLFPGRDLGRLAPGGEASFLVLGGDPLADFAQVKAIVRWVKQGRELRPPAVEMPPLGP